MQCPLNPSLCLYKTMVGAIIIFTLWMGLWFSLNPKNVIERQIAAYKLFRWKIEPVSWDKEIALTRTVGKIAVLSSIATSLLMIWRMSGGCGLR